MLFNGVAFSKHVEDLALVHPLFDFICIAFLFHVHDLVALYIQYMLAPFESCFKLSLLFLALSKLPFSLVNQILLKPDHIELCVKLTAICLKRICP